MNTTIVTQISEILEINVANIQLSIPTLSCFGDYSLPCFPFAKLLRKSPQRIAEELVCKFNHPLVEKTEAVNGYFNIFMKKSLSIDTLKKILTEENYGSGHSGDGKQVLIEHTSINPNASPHIGRGRNAMIGNALCNLLRFEDYDVDVHYFVNDIGKQIAMLVLETEGMSNIKFEDFLNIYIAAQSRAESDPEYVKKAFELLHNLENGDKQIFAKFSKIVDTCMEGQVKIFEELGIHYDAFDKESQFVLSGRVDEVLNELMKSGKLFEDEEHRMVLDLQDTVPESPFLPLTRADHSSLYPLRDITYTIEKIKMNSDKNIIVLGQDQKTYYKQIVEALKLLGYENAPELVCYQFVKLEDGKMSTRAGKVVLLEDLKKETIKRVSQNMEMRGYFDSERAKKIAYATVMYSILKCSPDKEVTFSWDEVLSFDGNSALYIMYNYARTQSLLKQAELEELQNVSFECLNTDIEQELLNTLGQYPVVIKEAIEKLNVFGIAKYVYTLTKLFSKYYNSTQIIDVDKPACTQARLYLAKAIGSIVKSGMQILGIEVVDRV